MNDYNWDEILESPDLCKLIYEDLGVSKREWNKLVKNQDLDEAYDAFYNVVSSSDTCFEAVCECDGYGHGMFNIHELCEFYFTDNPHCEGWAGPMPIDCVYDIAFFFTATGTEGVKFTIESSLDDETVFKIVGGCDRPITLNGVKYTHDGNQYIKTN